MSAVIRGSGAVCWPAWRCQSFSASTRHAQVGAREEDAVRPSGHELTVAVADADRCVHLDTALGGSVILSIASTVSGLTPTTYLRVGPLHRDSP